MADPLWQQFHTFRSLTRPPGGEVTLEVQNRVIGFLDKVHRTFPDKHVAIVSHGDPIKSASANICR
jgi:broad specificity phosphatase PhoE